MDEKKSIRFTLLLLISVYMIFAIASYVKPDNFFSEKESRVLAKKPVLSKETVKDGSFQTDYEAYVGDQVAGREKFIGLRELIDKVLGKKRTDMVYFGKNRYLFEIHLPQEFPDELVEEKLTKLGEFAEKEDATVILLPTSSGFYTEYLPLNAPTFSQKAMLDKAASVLDESQFIDGRVVLGDHKEEYLYCRSEQSITGLAAYYFYAPWCSMTKTSRYPYNINIIQTAAGSVVGRLERETRTGESTDAVLYQKEVLKHSVHVTYPDGTTVNSVYNDAALSTSHPFDYYLGGKKGVTELRTDSKQQRTLVVATGDNGLVFVPYLLSHFDKIVICNGVDAETLHKTIADEQEEGRETKVLAFYDCVELLQEFSY